MTRPTGFNPTEFMSSVEEMGGLSRRNRYSMSITPPTSSSFSIPSGKIDFLAISCLLPSKQFATTENRIYGFSKNIPYDVTYEPILVTFLNPNDWSTRKFWDEWLDYIQNPSSFNMQYYSKCTGTVEISVFDEENTSLSDTPRYTAVLQEAWPERMSAYALGYENSDHGNFEVSLRYKQWYEKGTTRHEKAESTGATKTFIRETTAHSQAELDAKQATIDAGNVTAH